MITAAENCKIHRINRNKKLTYIDAELSLWQECECSSSEHIVPAETSARMDNFFMSSSPALFSHLSILYF